MMQPQSLRSFLITLRGGQAVLPNSSLAEVLPCTMSTQLDGAPSWVMGLLNWKNHRVPLVSLEWLIHDTGPGINAYSRVVMVNALGKDAMLPYIGLLTTSTPQLMDLERSQITVDETAEPARPGVLSWVKIGDQRACIPDLDAIEAQLVPLMYRA